MGRCVAPLIVCLGSALVLAQAANEDSDTAAEIRALEGRLNTAVLTADLKTFDALLAEDFSHTNHRGEFRTKRQWLANHKAGQSPYDAYDTEDLSVRVYGDAAVATARTIPRGRDSKGQPITGQYRYTRVWARRDGRWQAVAFQGTRIASS
jgi:uncharacterized protein (TIGR02246 family)